MLKSLDTETTGVDLHHGAKPFLVTITDEEGVTTYWEWAVDPLTREPQVIQEDLDEIQYEINTATRLVLQNPNFDYRALQTVFKNKLVWDWLKVKDTLLAAHILNSNRPKDLTTLALVHLGINIKPYEDRMCHLCNEARRFVRRHYPDWRIAHRDLPEMPSAKDTVWKNDMWLLRAVASAEQYPPDHEYWTACADYANADSGVTLPIYEKQLDLLNQRGLLDIYNTRLQILSIVDKMESRGVSVNGKRWSKLVEEFEAESQKAADTCTDIASRFNYELALPKSGNNKSLLSFCFDSDKLSLPVVAKTDKGNPSINKTAVDTYLAELKESSPQHQFVNALSNKRKRDTAVNYLRSYKRFWKPIRPGWYRLHPSLNPTGTATLRWSSANPNQQNISKQEGFNLRHCFGPLPGREWWSLDANNIELRLPAYEAGEEEMVALFERPNDPPYYGSNHLLMFDVLHPDKFAKHGADVKKVYASTWYQWTKNGNFAVQYGAVEQSGTADRAYHVQGAQRKIQSRFTKITRLNKSLINFADKHGYVETMPDKTVCPDRGYPLLCSRSNWGTILPTVPLNYHVQGTAMWWMMKAMIRCQAYLDELNSKGNARYYMVMQVHDELVFDFPHKPNRGNLPKINKIRRLMEQGGDDIGVPTPVGIDYHPTSWSEST